MIVKFVYFLLTNILILTAQNKAVNIIFMDFNEYQEFTKTTALYPKIGGHGILYPVLGLSGEVGEVSEKIKKIFRDKNGVFGVDDTGEITKELGDVLWYISQISAELGVDLDDVATRNISKLTSRKDRDQLHGNGDNR